VSLALGTTHFATFLSQEGGNIPRGLAAYNAGPSRVTLWAAKRGADDSEIFVERIPFAETRDYVRNILRNRDIYAALYKL
jgi:soluble lytic murein transglycosylase